MRDKFTDAGPNQSFSAKLIAWAEKTAMRLPEPIVFRLRAVRNGRPWATRPGKVRMGQLRRLEPFSRMYGWDRGTPVDRYYIEAFLKEHSGRIAGRVLEISENTYTYRFGGTAVTSSDVLHYDNPSPPATITGDLTDAPHIPSDSFDCVIITQTLMLIYDVPAALRTIHRILKPGGTVLVTQAGLSQIADPEWRHTWYWGFTQASSQRLFQDAFPGGWVEARAYGNMLSTIAFLAGLGFEELDKRELDHVDPDYQLLIGVIATKAGGPPA